MPTIINLKKTKLSFGEKEYIFDIIQDQIIKHRELSKLELLSGEITKSRHEWNIGHDQIMKFTPENITTLKDNEVFVFGSNYAGRHGAGAARLAWQKFGAKMGVGMGMSGQTYGIATKDRNIQTLPLHKISVQVDKFIRFSLAHPELEFLVTQIGCGLAGYSVKDIAPMFKGTLPPNVVIPQVFYEYNLKA
jgi:hypothetical protein